MQLKDKVYDVLKWVCMVCIPALTTFYVCLDKVFGWGCAEIVATVSSGLCACIGALIGISTAEYRKTVE